MINLNYLKASNPNWLNGTINAYFLTGKRFALIWVWLLMPCVLFSQSIEVYPAPAGVAGSAYFSVRARIDQQPWQPVFVYHSANSLDRMLRIVFDTY